MVICYSPPGGHSYSGCKEKPSVCTIIQATSEILTDNVPTGLIPEMRKDTKGGFERFEVPILVCRLFIHFCRLTRVDLDCSQWF